MKKHNGFTLIELIIVMAIAGILLAAVAPSMRAFIANSASKSLSNTLLIDIMYARNYAITNSVIVKMLPIGENPAAADGFDSLASLFVPDAEGVNWGLGYLIFVDNNNNDVYDAPEFILRNYASFGPDTQVSSGPGAHIANGPNNLLDRTLPIGFNPSGTAIRPGVLSIATFGCAGDNASTIQINNIGQVVVTSIDCPITFTNQ